MRTRGKLIAGLVQAGAMWGVPAAATAVSVSREGVRGEEYSNWQGVRVVDTKSDGNGVYSQFYRDSGSYGEVHNDNGNGTSEESGTSTNLVRRFNACNDLNNRPDPCTDYVSR